MPITEADVQEVIAPMHTKGGLIALIDSMPDDCEWVMVNPDPNILGLSGTGILNKDGVRNSTQRLLDGLAGTPVYTVSNIMLSQGNNGAAIELHSKGKAKNGKDFDNYQCWVIEAEDQASKIKTKKVRVYFDTAHVLRTLEDCAN